MAEEKENVRPAYWGVITAEVRYDDKIPDKAKLLFSEITALSNSQGYCNASNGYFAGIYQRDASTVSRWFSSLRKRKHVAIELIYEGKEVVERRVFPKGSEGYLQIVLQSKEGDAGIIHSTQAGKLITVKPKPKDKVKKAVNSFTPPTREQLGRYVHEVLQKLPKVVTGKHWAVYLADTFIEHYDEHGWKRGKLPMKNWKLTAREWVKSWNEKRKFFYACPTSPEFLESKNRKDQQEAVNIGQFESPLDRVE